MLRVEGLSKRFGPVPVIRDISLEVAAGERVAILGPNGAGKTTLLSLIAGQIAADAGRIHLDGRDITRLPADARARHGLGRSFQTTTLFEERTIAENLIMAEAARGRLRAFFRDPLRDPGLQARAAAMAVQFGLDPVGRAVAALDHGTRRALDLAMAMAGAPRLVLLDEPASGLGSGLGSGGNLHDLIVRMPRSISLIMIEHDLDLAFALADRIMVLDAGQIVFDGAPAGARPVLKAIYDA